MTVVLGSRNNYQFLMQLQEVVLAPGGERGQLTKNGRMHNLRVTATRHNLALS